MNKTFYKLKKTIVKFLDPFLVLAILVVFAVPAITVLNLTPAWKEDNSTNAVLGTTDQTNLMLSPYQTMDQGLQVIEVNQTTDTSYSFTIENIPHEKGKYTNKIFDIFNPTDFQKQMAIEPTFKDVPDGTKVSVKIDDTKHVILEEGTSYPVGIFLQGKEEFPVYVVVESDNDVNFLSNFILDINLE